LIAGSSHLIIAVICGFVFGRFVVFVAKRSNVIKLSTSLACQWQQQQLTATATTKSCKSLLACSLRSLMGNSTIERMGENGNGNGNEAHAQPAAAY